MQYSPLLGNINKTPSHLLPLLHPSIFQAFQEPSPCLATLPTMCETCGCNPPGNLPDLTPENRKLWCKNYISKWMTGEINADSDVVSPGRTKLTQFFNACEQPGDYETAAVTWVAFPKLVCYQSSTFFFVPSG